MKSRWKRWVCHGVIEGYSYGKKDVILYLLFYDKNKRKKVAYKIPVWSLYYRLQNLVIYRKDGSLDFGKLEGMRVCVEMVSCGNRVYVKKIMSDFPLYGTEKEQ